jgi:multidrug efflux pump subunit AcrA (membrane-fusion protein)
VVTPPSSGGNDRSTYVAPAPTIDPAVAAAAAAKALAEAKVAEAKATADAKALAEKKAAEEAALLATIKALQEKTDAEALAAAKRVQEELAAAQVKADEELKAASAALKLADEQRIAAALAASKKITTLYSTSAAFKLNTTYTQRLKTYTKKIAAGSTVTCIGYAKSSKTLSYAKAKVVATKQAKALCSSMKKINPTLITKSAVYPASKAPKTTVNKKWIPVSYRVAGAID